MLSRNQEQEKIMFIIYEVLFFNRMKSPFDIVEITENTMDENYENVSTFVKEVTVKCLLNYENGKNQFNCYSNFDVSNY